MTPAEPSRRRFLVGVGSAGIVSLAGCTGSSDPDSGFEFRELDSVHELQDTRSVLLSESVLDSKNFELEPRQQIRLGQGQMTTDGEPEDESASEVRPHNPTIFTLRETRPVDVGTYEVVIESDALDVIGASEGDPASFVTYAPHPDITTRAGAKSNNEYIEEIIDDGDGEICFIAPHGGQVHSHTARMANRAATSMGESAWVTRAFEDDTETLYNRWYVPATEIHPNAYPKLRELEAEFELAVSFGGFDSSGPDAFSGEGVTVGGLADTDDIDLIRRALVREFDSAGVDGVKIHRYPNGAPENPSSEHIVNRLTDSGRHGVEVRATTATREQHWAVIADGVEQGVRDMFADE